MKILIDGVVCDLRFSFQTSYWSKNHTLYNKDLFQPFCLIDEGIECPKDIFAGFKEDIHRELKSGGLDVISAE